MDINGTPVNSWRDPDDPTKTPNLSVTFDSTHFADGTPINIAYTITDTAGDPTVDQDVSASAYNKAYCLGIHTLGFNILVPYYIADILTEANYTTDAGITDHASTILASLPAYTAFYITTHANQSGFGDCYDNMTGILINYDDVGTAVTSKTVYEPPYNIIFIDGCYSAGVGNVASEGASKFGISGPDTAFIGWNTFIWATANVDWTEDLWSNMRNGETVYDAVVGATAEDGSPIGAIGNEYIPQYVSPIIQGDNSMTLHGVYLGTGVDQWFRAHLH